MGWAANIPGWAALTATFAVGSALGWHAVMIVQPADPRGSHQPWWRQAHTAWFTAFAAVMLGGLYVYCGGSAQRRDSALVRAAVKAQADLAAAVAVQERVRARSGRYGFAVVLDLLAVSPKLDVRGLTVDEVSADGQSVTMTIRRHVGAETISFAVTVRAGHVTHRACRSSRNAGCGRGAWTGA